MKPKHLWRFWRKAYLQAMANGRHWREAPVEADHAMWALLDRSDECKKDIIRSYVDCCSACQTPARHWTAEIYQSQDILLVWCPRCWEHAGTCSEPVATGIVEGSGVLSKALANMPEERKNAKRKYSAPECTPLGQCRPMSERSEKADGVSSTDAEYEEQKRQRVEYIRKYFSRDASKIRRNIVVLVWAIIRGYDRSKPKKPQK